MKGHWEYNRNNLRTLRQIKEREYSSTSYGPETPGYKNGELFAMFAAFGLLGLPIPIWILIVTVASAIIYAIWGDTKVWRLLFGDPSDNPLIDKKRKKK